MKKILSITLLTLVSLTISELAEAQKYSALDKSPADIAYYRPGGRNSEPVAKVIYSRPQKKGREMIGKTEPYGKVWRAGANETTEIKFYKDVTFGDKKVKAGTYSLYLIPNKDKWTVILNSKLDTWGAYGYDQGKDVARVEASVGKPASEVEAFSIAFADSKMYIAWENHQIGVSVK